MSKSPNKTITPLERAKIAAGGTVALAKAMGGSITPQAISQWDKIPLGRVFAIEQATGIPRGELRPDFFGDDV